MVARLLYVPRSCPEIALGQSGEEGMATQQDRKELMQEKETASPGMPGIPALCRKQDKGARP